MNAITNAAGLAITALSLDGLFQHQEDPDKQIYVSLLNGDAPSGDGSIPHIALWDEGGSRIGQYHGSANGHLGKEQTKTITINPTQNGNHQATPHYLLLSMEERDAICLSVITVAGNSVQWIWTGDMGYTCGAQWYHSGSRFGSSNKEVKCVWFDKDHTNHARAEGLSLHLPSFATDEALVHQYSANDARLCRVIQRMTFHESITSDSLVATFQPPLKYTSDGAVIHPDRYINRYTRAYNDRDNRWEENHRKPATKPKQKPDDHKRSHVRDWDLPRRGNSTSTTSTTSTVPSIRGKNSQPDRLVISKAPGHSARELCEHPNSLGPDFSITEGCFDLDTRRMRHSEDTSEDSRMVGNVGTVRVKEYKKYDEW
ncbi:hypothetical protein BJY00DRAFT_320069 [Aspergillus carlsbadensis]|nr:hypothetical protein BJY00DRAFT_320069 [Aspergillus carlsbadensis]